MKSYQKRYCEVLDYIEAHLEEDLSVEMLSEVACLSRFHFHRQFSALMGIGVSAYIKRLRLKRAAYQLAYRHEIKVIDIAFTNGYESPEAFSRAFKQLLGCSPTSFREHPDWNSWHEINPSLTQLKEFRMHNHELDIEVKIVDFEAVKVATLQHRGPAHQLGPDSRASPSSGMGLLI